VLPSHPQANELGVNLYGLSYHFPKTYHSSDYLNEFNPGIGLRATFGTRKSGHFIIEGETFEDSMENQAKYFSLGYLVRIVYLFRIGINAGIYSSETFQNPSTFFVPVPIVSYTFGPFTANTVYYPKYSDFVPYHILGFYATVRIFEGVAAKK